MRNKVFMWLLFASVYCMQLPFVIQLVLLMAELEIPQAVIDGVDLISLVFCAITIVLCFVNLLVAALDFSKKIKPPYKLTAAVKLCLIPFYVVNFIISLLFVVGTLNPFLFWLTPVFLAISLVATYIFMIGTSVHNMSYLLKQAIKTKRLKYILYLIAHFIYVADVGGIFILRPSSFLRGRRRPLRRR